MLWHTLVLKFLAGLKYLNADLSLEYLARKVQLEQQDPIM